MPDPIRPTDDDARALARDLAAGARLGALGVLDPAGGHPAVSRVAVGWAGGPVLLISSLSHHTRALRADPRASLLVGEPGPRGDPLNQPRLTLFCAAGFVARDSDDHGTLREMWLARHPKAKIYIDFADFAFVRLAVRSASLNGGFGKAYELTPADLGL